MRQKPDHQGGHLGWTNSHHEGTKTRGRTEKLCDFVPLCWEI